MAGITKNLYNFDHDTEQAFIVNSSLSNILISNSSSTKNIFVTLELRLPDGSSYLLNNVEVPTGVTLQMLENEPLRVQSAKALIRYTVTGGSSPTDDDLMTVTYTSS